MIGLAEIEAAAQRVYAAMAPTPQYAWPLLSRRVGCEVWVKHEKHTPTGAFKVCGGLNLLGALAAAGELPQGVISATRGNHGQSLAFAARRHRIACTVVVPHGNSPAKNRAMREWGAVLVEHGRDFYEARVHAAALAAERGLRSFRATTVYCATSFARANRDCGTVRASALAVFMLITNSTFST